MNVFDNRVVLIPKNEQADTEAGIRVEILREKGIVRIGQTGWSGQDKQVEFPVQFLGDVQNALRKIGEVTD